MRELIDMSSGLRYYRSATLVFAALMRPSTRRMMLGAVRAYQRSAAFKCPLCDFRGRFLPAGSFGRQSVYCPSCRSAERHRLLKLALRDRFVVFEGKHVLHFAPEAIVSSMITNTTPAEYVSADLVSGRADRTLNIEEMELSNCSFDVVVCSHVLEHVDDSKALAEIYRILKPGGMLIAMVPIVEGWVNTYEDPEIVEPDMRALHFGQADHVRWYGADFRDRIRSKGFDLLEYTATGSECAQYGLLRGEKIFLAKKNI